MPGSPGSPSALRPMGRDGEPVLLTEFYQVVGADCVAGSCRPRAGEPGWSGVGVGMGEAGHGRGLGRGRGLPGTGVQGRLLQRAQRPRDSRAFAED